jgi:hypothetical protein
MSVERGCGPESRHRAAGARLRAVTVVAWHATVICDAFGRDMDARAPRRTPLSATPGLRGDAPKRVRLIAIQDAPVHAQCENAAARRDVVGVRLNRALEGDDWKRALHALGAMRRMCPWGTDAIHQHTPAEIPRQLASLSPPEASESRPSRNSPGRAARRRRQCPKARPPAGSKRSEEH